MYPTNLRPVKALVLIATVYSGLMLCSTMETKSRTGLNVEFESRFFDTSTAFHPSAVMIVYDNTGNKEFRVLCTGNLIKADWILTAAQCLEVEDVKYIRLWAGFDSTQEALDFPGKGQVRFLEAPLKHPEYRVRPRDFRYDEDDFACLKVTVPFLITDRVDVIKISTSPLKPGEEHFCSITGFCRGSEDIYRFDRNYGSNTIRDRSVTVTPKCYCNLHLPWWKKTKDPVGFRAPFICDNQRRARELTSRLFCEGDAGAGLVCKDLLYGVFTALLKSSFFDSCSKAAAQKIFGTKEDARPDTTFTVAFVDTCTHIKWINEHAKMYWPDDISKGGCGDRENEFKRNRAKIKDPKMKYWGQYLIQGPSKDPNEEGEEGEEDVDDEKSEEEDYDSGITTAAKPIVLFGIAIIVIIVR